MSRLKSVSDTSGELVIQRFGNGVKLFKPESVSKGTTVSNILKLPCNVHFLNRESVIQNINETSVVVCGFPSVKEAIGKNSCHSCKKRFRRVYFET